MTSAMQKIAYSDHRINKIQGINWLRVIRQVTEGKE
jgi:membrane dipeptidase